MTIVRGASGLPEQIMLGSTLEQEFAWQIRMLQLPTPTFQYRFLPPRRFRFDVAYPDLKLAVELNGATWVQGRHTRGQGAASDAEKLSLAAIHGWCVLVAVAEQVRDGRAVKWLEGALQRRNAV